MNEEVNNEYAKKGNKKLLVIIIAVLLVVGVIIFILCNKSTDSNKKGNSKDNRSKQTEKVISDAQYQDLINSYGRQVYQAIISKMITDEPYTTYNDIKDEIGNDTVKCEVVNIEINGDVTLEKCHIDGIKYNPNINFTVITDNDDEEPIYDDDFELDDDFEAFED